MIRVGIHEDDKRSDRGGWLILNREIINESQVYKSDDGGISGDVYDAAAVTLLLGCNLSEIGDHFTELTLPLPMPVNDIFKHISIARNTSNENDNIRLHFDYHPDLTVWAKSWSVLIFRPW